MAFPEKNKTYLNQPVPVGEKGQKYITELKKIRDDLENLRHLTDQVKKSKTISVEKMAEINSIVENLKKDIKKLNRDFPELPFKLDSN
jgi:predicted nuclease with TOPRIM domain